MSPSLPDPDSGPADSDSRPRGEDLPTLGFPLLPAAETEATQPGAPPDPADPAGAPDRVGPYHLLRVLGEGGMGTVSLAEQSEPLQRQVALKLVRAGRFDRKLLRRFEAERQALARMNHPNIAQV